MLSTNDVDGLTSSQYGFYGLGYTCATMVTTNWRTNVSLCKS
jgi:hypothetical protein